MDAIAWGSVLGAVAATGAAVLSARAGRSGHALALLVAAGLLLNGNLAWRHWLSPWDERYHAVVARNVLDAPLRPTLIADPFDARPLEAWTEAHVWLHKPPLTTWSMAGAMAVLGENEIAARVPSLALVGLGIVLTFWLGRRFFGTTAGLLAAGLHAWHGRMALHASGLRATDHVDQQMMVWVALSACLAIGAADALRGDGRLRRGLALAAACGVAAGAGWLTKSVLGLVGVGVLGLALLAGPIRWPVRVAAGSLALATLAVVALPWQLYAREAFPELAAFYTARNLRYFTEAVDGHGGPGWFYLRDMGKMFGVLAPLAVALVAFDSLRHRERWPLCGWLFAVYGVFSVAATKMTGYVFVAAPVVLVFLAAAATEAFSAPRSRRVLALRAIAVLALVSFALGSAWRVHRPWRAPARTEILAEELRTLGESVASLEPGRWVVFNVPAPTEAQFYLRATPVGRVPSDADLTRAREAGFRVAVYGERDAPALRALARRPDVTWIPLDPRTVSARALLGELPEVPPRTEIDLWNARTPERLEAYLERFRPVDVSAVRPAALEARPRKPSVLLLGRDEPAPAVVPEGWSIARSDVLAASGPGRATPPERE